MTVGNENNPWFDMSNPLRRVINPNDGEAFKFERKVQYYTLTFLCAAATVVMLLPASWLDNYFIQTSCNTFNTLWPKLKTESKFFDTLSPFRGTRHTIMHVFSTLTVVGLMLFYSLPKLKRLLVKHGTKLTEFHKVSGICVIIMFLCIAYLHIFDTGFFTSTAKVSRGIGRSQLLWYWTALQSTVLLIFCHMALGMYVKFKKFKDGLK